MFTATPHPHLQSTRFTRPTAILLVLAAATLALVAFVVGQGATQRPAGSAPPRLTAMTQPLSRRLLAPSTSTGLVRIAAPAHIHVTARLRRLGFVAGINEQLHGLFPMQAQAVSVVEEFHSAAAARAELAYEYKTSAVARGQALERYHVGGIPGALGFNAHYGRTTGMNVMFTSGAFFYLIGAAVSRPGHGAPTRASLIAAAQTMYLMANGCVASGGQAHLA
jgi:hypothetical protein